MNMNTIPLTPVQLEIERKIGLNPGALTAEALRRWQLTKINQTLKWCRGRSPFYRDRLSSCPDEIRSLEEFAAFPFTTTEDLETDGLRMVCVSQDEVERIVTLDTSGTTGKPKRLYFSRADQQLTIDFFGVGMSTLIAQGSRVLILLPGSLPGSVGDLLAKGLAGIGSIGVHHGSFDDPFPVCERIAQEKIDALVGAPKQVYALMRAWQFAGKGKCGVRSLLLSTDYASPILMKEIESVWDCRVFQHYGMTEAGLGVGIDCAAIRGFHMRDADIYFEIIDPETGSLVPDGVEGEVVMTTLTRDAMPLIRYRAKDISRFIPGACPCGTALKTMAWTRKRIQRDDALPYAISDVDDYIFTLPDVTGYTPYLRGRTLRIELYRVDSAVPFDQDRIARDILARLPGLERVTFDLREGFNPFTYNLAKKRILREDD